MNNLRIIFQGKTGKLDGLVIRYPRIEDLKLMHLYINKLSRERTYIIFQGEKVTEKEEKDYIKNYLDKIKNKQALPIICLKENELVSVADIIMKERNQKHVGILGLTVAKKYRGMGIGRLMMKLLLQHAKNKLPELKIITLNVFAENKIAFNLYKKFGFKQYGVLPNGTYFRDKLMDYVEMYREI